MQQVNLGIIGGGTVGGGVYEALQRNGPLLASRIGATVKVHRVGRAGPETRNAPSPFPKACSRPTGAKSFSILKSSSSPNWSAALTSRGKSFWPHSSSASRSSPRTRRCFPRTARNCLPPPKNTAPIFITKPASAAAFPSSNHCAKVLSATASTRFTASSTAPAITSSPA